MLLLSKENIFKFILLAFVFIIPISQDNSIRLLVVAIVSSLFLIGNPNWKKDFLDDGWDLLLYFSILALGLIYTEDLTSGISVLEKNLSFIMIPLVFGRLKFLDKPMLNRICGVFTAGVIVAALICLGNAIYEDVYLGYSGGYYYDAFTTIIDAQPTYMAYYVCFSIIYLLYLISYESTSRIQRFLIVICILFLSSVLMLTAGRSTFVSLLMMSSFFFLKLVLEPYPIKRKIQGISVTLLLLAVILFQSPFAQRLFPQFLSERSASLDKMKGDTWERIVLWESALNASPNLTLGVGTGDHTSMMNEYYRRNQLDKFAAGSFNAHNQFIQILFSNGILGLLAVVIILVRPILLSMQRQNIFGMLTFFPFLIYGISEVFLGRYQGIVFFVLLHQIFIKYLNRNLEKVSVKNL